MAIIELITSFLKLALEFLKLWLQFSAEERSAKIKKIKTYCDSITDTIVNDSSFLNETAYYASISQEKQVRYKLYREVITPVLLQGKGISELEMLTVSGLNFRLAYCKDKVINVLACGQSAINRSKLIAQLLVEVSSV